ncbi:DUF3322 domain-containing protein [Azonexus sp.]|uniref:DUF3322 domain-containing protein n=1 Tax=Azonexus sp. TaxID=1872668 RepID=UPI0035B451B8
MSWSTPTDLRAQLARLWERGELLRDTLNGTPRFPLRLTLKTPSSSDLSERFEAVREWTATLAKAPLRIEWQEVRHRVQGKQRLPAATWIDTAEGAIAWLGKQDDWAQFARLVESTRQACPALLPWLEKRPLQALALTDAWPRLLAVVAWRQAHPRPGIYLRQVDLAGIHSKFIEAHRAVLAELFDLALPAEQIDASRSGSGQFAARYGFREKSLRIRWRPLDPDIATLPGLSAPDVTLDADSFSRLTLPVRTVIITENETNFLTLPELPGALAIFGAGYGWEALSGAKWLANCTLLYWGDIDTHGFAILDQLRGHFPGVESFLMDRATLDAHAAFRGSEDKPLKIDLHRLTTAEQTLYDDLRDNRIADSLRLEQEHLGYTWVLAHLRQRLGLSDRARGYPAL